MLRLLLIPISSALLSASAQQRAGQRVLVNVLAPDRPQLYRQASYFQASCRMWAVCGSGPQGRRWRQTSISRNDGPVLQHWKVGCRRPIRYSTTTLAELAGPPRIVR